MPNTIRIKRRSTGNAGAPASLENAELAFNEVDNTLYYGKGSGGSGGSATTVDAIGGRGAFVSLGDSQTISGAKTFSGTVSLGSGATATTPATATNNTSVATTAFVKAQNYLTGNQGITVSGDASGSGATAIALTLAGVGTAGTYTKVTTDAKGRVTAGTTLAVADIPTLTASKTGDFDTQVRTSRLDQMASPTAAVGFNNQRITSLADPVGAQDAATKAYVDAARTGLDAKASVRVATTGNITLSGVQTIDGVAVAAGDRVLVKNQTTATQNGIYLVAAGAWTRSDDADANAEVTPGLFTFVESGTVNSTTGWVLSGSGAIVVGTTAINFAQFSGAGAITAGAGLTQTGTTLSVNASEAGGLTAGSQLQLAGQALALHQLATNGMIVRTGNGTVAARSITSNSSGIGVTAGDGVGGNPTIFLSNILGPLGALTPASNNFPYIDGSGVAQNAPLTAFGRSLMADADAAEGRATLLLGTISTQNANNVSITGGTIDNVVFDGGTF
jgi:hypothetical protein